MRNHLRGENGSGKSTLLDAIAVNFGFNPEGGSKNFSFSSYDTHSPLFDYLTVAKGRALSVKAAVIDGFNK